MKPQVSFYAPKGKRGGDTSVLIMFVSLRDFK